MARKRYDMTEKKIARFIREGRGRGRLADYRPWLRVQDVPSCGRSHRPYGYTTDRVHEFLSDGEYMVFVLADWDDRVVDIREQFPLDRGETFRIARTMGIRPPLTAEGMPYPMTTDFLLNVRQGTEERMVAYSCKVAADAKKRRSVELFEVQRRYWLEQGIECRQVLKETIPRVVFHNVDRLRPYMRLDGVFEFHPGAVEELAQEILTLLESAPDVPVNEWCRSVDGHLAVQESTALNVVRYLLARKLLVTDMSSSLPFESRSTRSLALAPSHLAAGCHD